MYDPSEKVKFNISGCLKDLNKRYHRNYTLQDVASTVGVSRETLSRMSTSSSFSLVYSVAECLYQFYPDYNSGCWNFVTYAELLSWDDLSFLL